ncbi:MAG: hypothetical protein OXF51_01715, partial [Alphaproteobacteria bacterium]|nr:hypothetical protein [Alphaproteobacteria bacterium]
CPCHGFEVAELRQDFDPPIPGDRGAPAPWPLKVRDPEGPDDRLTIMESGGAARGSTRLLAAGGKFAGLQATVYATGCRNTQRGIPSE